jgi:arylsulfatase A-like enzyme
MDKRGRIYFGHTKIAILISCFLTLATVLAVTFTAKWTLRDFYNICFFFLLSLNILLTNALFFSRERKYLSDGLRKVLRISVIVLYAFIYLVALGGYIFTGQITRFQTLLFAVNMQPFIWLLAFIFILLLVIFSVVAYIYRKTRLKDYSNKKSKRLLVFSIVIRVLLVVVLLSNLFLLKIENPLLKNDEKLIAYDSAGSVVIKNVSKLNQTNEKYNVVFILLESVSAERLGLYGYERNVSPNIDNLGNKSIVFDNAYATATHSDYAQPSLLASRYMLVNNYRNFFSDDSPRKFVWQLYKDNNYRTGYFSSQDDNWQNMEQYINYSGLDNWSYSLTDGVSDYGFGYAKKDMDHKTVELALNWLNNSFNESRPFFIYLNFQATHSPQVYSEEYNIYLPSNEGIFGKTDSVVSENRYDNALTYVDAQVGKVLKFLEENNLTNNTIIAISADHGHDLENRHNINGHGNSLYNDELVIPALVFIPNVKPTRVKERVSQIDFVPTLIDLVGMTIPKEFQGQVMKVNRPIFSASQSNKYLVSLIQDDIKVIADMNRKLVEVYNLSSDPNELKPLDYRDYEDHILELLFWLRCQKEYYGSELWKNFKSDRCTKNNNFLV